MVRKHSILDLEIQKEKPPIWEEVLKAENMVKEVIGTMGVSLVRGCKLINGTERSFIMRFLVVVMYRWIL